MWKCHVSLSQSACYLIPFFFPQSELLLPKAHNLLLVAIAFSSTILLNPNPHIDLLCTLVINYPQVKRLKMSWTEAGQGHFTESHLINIFIFVWLDPQSFYTVNACVWVFHHTWSEPCQLYGPTVIEALICLLMTDVMQSHFAAAVDKICRWLDASLMEPPPYPTVWSANIWAWNASEESADLLIN